MPRVLILSNRLPVTHCSSDGGTSVVGSDDGPATALSALHEAHDGLWIGWPGIAPHPGDAQRALDARLAERGAIAVHLDSAEVARGHERFANGTLWPLFHYFIDRSALGDHEAFATYERVNQRFADVAVAHHRPGDLVWVHDHPLMLVPEMLRARLPRARIGFFLHTPFPASEVLRVLVWRKRLLRGLLGADVIGLQTESYRDHLLDALRLELGIEPDGDVVEHGGRRVRLGVHPVGADARTFAELLARASVRVEAARIRERAPGRRIALAVDRLDYTQGIRLRLAAIERLLDRSPEMRDVRFVQIVVSGREGASEELRREVYEMVSRINARHGSIDFVPVALLHQPVPIERLGALYAAADAMLVTPLRDGMSFQAKEYVAARLDGTGALVLSELSGAAPELDEALIVNPYDTGGVAVAIELALTMSLDEQRARMSALRRSVTSRDVHRWARCFVGDLERSGAPSRPRSIPRVTEAT